MASESIDELEIEVEVSSSSASSSLSRLKTKLQNLQSGLNEVDSAKLSEVADSLNKLGSVNFDGFNHIPSPSKFKRLAEGISALAEIDTGKLTEVADAIDKISASTASLNAGGGEIQMPSISTQGAKGQSFDATNDIVEATEAEEDLSHAGEDVADSQEKASEATRKLGNDAKNSSGESTSAFESLRQRISSIVSSLQGMGNSVTNAFSGVMNGVSKIGSGIGTIARMPAELLRIGNAAGQIEKKALSAGKGLAKISAQASPLGKLPAVFDKISNACSGLNSKLTRSVRLFTMMAMRSAFRKIMDELGTSFEHLAQKSEEVNNRYSSLISSMNQLAHSIAALAQPLLNIFGPALQYIINLLNTAINYVNQFLSALTGKKYYTTGKNVAYDYAASLQDEAEATSEASSAQKELNKQLQGFNELNNLTTSTSGSSGSPSSGGTTAPEDLEDCYEELAINQKILDLVEKLKDLLSQIFEPMKAAWDKYGQGVVDALQYALSSVWQLIKDIGSTWLKVWSNGSGEKLCGNILQLLTSILNWIGDIATAWDQAWKTKGEAYVQSIFDELNAVLETVIDISETFREAFNNGAGVEMIEHFYQILTNTNNNVKDMVYSFKDAWDEMGRGEAIANTFFSAINNILDAIEKIQESWSAVWNNGTGKEICEKILDIILLIEEAVNNVATAFKKAWEEGERGTAFIQSILDKFSSILQIIKDIGTSLLTVWSNGSGAEIIGHILDIFTNINQAVKNLATNFDNAWNHAGIGTSIIQGLADVANILLTHAQNIFQNFKDWTSKLDFGPLLTAFNDLVEAVKPLADNVGQGLEWFFKNVAQPLAKWAVQNLIPTVIDGIKKAIDLLNTIIDAAKENLGWVWADFLKPMGEWTGSAITAFIEALGDALQGLADVINGDQTLWGWIKQIVSGGSDYWYNIFAGVSKDSSNWDEHAWTAIDSGGKSERTTVGVKINNDSSSDSTATKAIDSDGKTLRPGASVSIKKDGSSDETATKAIESDGKTLRPGASVSIKKDSSSDETATKAIDSDGKTLRTGSSVNIAKDSSSDATATKAIESDGKEESTVVRTEIAKTKSSNETAVKAIDSNGKTLSTDVDTQISKNSSSDKTAVQAIETNMNNKKIDLVASTEIMKAANSDDTAVKAIDSSDRAELKTGVSTRLSRSNSWDSEAWTALEAGADQAINETSTNVKLKKSGWDTITGWFKDKFGGLFGGSSSDESITVKVKLDKKGSDKVSDILDDTQTVVIKLSNKSDKLSKVLDEEFTTKVKISNKSDKLSSWLDDTFTTTVKISKNSDKLSSILEDTFTTKVKLEKSGWTSLKDWIGGAEVEATVKLTPAASSLWNTLKADWNKVAGTVEFSAAVKDESSSWWSNTQKYWSTKVGTVDKFKTDVKDDSATWWKNTQNYWSKKVGQVEKFKTDVKDDSATWWQNTNTYWNKVVGYVKEFQVNVKDDSATWWKDVSNYWDKESSSKYLIVKVRGEVETKTNWWTEVQNNLLDKIGTIYPMVRGSVDTGTNWWSNVNSSVKSWIGTVYVPVRGTVDWSYNWWSGVNNSIRAAVGTVTVSVRAVRREKGGVFENGAWSDIPQYAGGTTNAGSMFIAGENGPELVGNIGNRTEVLNASQLAAVMESAVIGGIAKLSGYLNDLYKQITICANGIIGAIAVNYDTPEIVPDMSGCTNNNYSDFKEQYGADMNTVVSLLSQIADNTEGEDVLRSDPNGLFTIMRRKNEEYRNTTGQSAFA